MSSTFIFIFLAKAEGQENKTIENESIFAMIFMQQLMAIGVVQIFTEASFEGFNMAWYMTVGSSLCLAMCLNMFSTKASETGKMMIVLFLRCWDRRCVCSN